MQWIRECRERMGLELDEFARVVNTYRRFKDDNLKGIVSDALIHLLEVSGEAVTHPTLADAIATVCGATPAQRDSIVAQAHRGGWKPTPGDAKLVKKAILKVNGKMPPKAVNSDDTAGEAPQRAYIQRRGVAKVDQFGNMLEFYASVTEAANANQVSEKYVRNRCKRLVADIPKYVRQCGFTFRYADEWESMTREQRMKDIKQPVRMADMEG